MMRLLERKENKKVTFAYINSDYSLEFVESEDRKKENNTDKIVSGFTINKYTQLLDIIQHERESKTEKTFFAMIYQDKYFLLFRKELNFKVYFIASYEIECDEIKEMLRTVFGFSGENFRTIMMNKTNKFNFLVFQPVLELFFAEASIRSRGEAPYREFKIKKKNGKLRQIIAPHNDIKKLLKKINMLLQGVYDKRNGSFQVAYKKGKNIADNTSIHRERKYIMTADLKDFFPSCKKELVRKYTKFLFKNSINQQAVEEYFLNIVLWNDALFIGSPISGTLANAILSPAVKYIKNICDGFDMNFSIYADDMTFSSDKFLTVGFVKNIFALAFTTYGLDEDFHLNEEKFHGYSGTNRRSVGLAINPENKLTVPNKKFREMRTRIHHLHYGTGSKGGDLRELKGLISYATAYDENGKVYRLLKKYEDTVRKHNLCSDNVLTKLEEKFNA